MKLLIVDDEIMTREGLMKTVDWPALGVDMCLFAMNALQGLDLVRANMPDILLCDVRMPGMDGIEMARNVRIVHPDCQLIMMSGYNDRQYVKDAIDLQAVAFLDKPIRMEALEGAVCEAVARAKQASDSRQTDAIARMMLCADYARCLMRGQEIKDERVRRVGPESRRGIFRCILVHPLQQDRRFLQELLDSRVVWGVCAPGDDGNDVVFLCAREEQKFHDILSAITGQSEANRVAVGDVIEDLDASVRSYASAKSALTTMFYRAHSRIAYPSGDAEPLDLTPYLEEFQSLLLLDRDRALLSVESFREALMQHTSTPVDLTKSHYYTMARLIFGGNRERVDSLLDDIGRESLWDACTRAQTLDELERIIWKAFRIMESPGEEQDGSYVVQEAKKLIQRNYIHAKLSLEDIAEGVHMSVGHLSVLFKNATGYTLHQYITRCRLERACALLLKTDLRNQEIAGQIGFSNANYFIRVFTSEIGMTPQTYRKQYR